MENRFLGRWQPGVLFRSALTQWRKTERKEGGLMRTEEEIKEFLKELEERHSSSANMGYERAGAIAALEWVLDRAKVKPGIGRRF